MQVFNVMSSMYNYSGDLVYVKSLGHGRLDYKNHNNTPKRQVQPEQSRAMGKPLVLMHNTELKTNPQIFGSMAGNAGYKSWPSEAYSSAGLLDCCSSLTNAS